MFRWGRVSTFLAPLLVALAVLEGIAAEEDSREKGMRIFLEAREQAGVNDKTEPLRDCRFDMVTRLEPQGGKSKKAIELPSRVSFLAPSTVRQEIETPVEKAVVVFDGQRGWRIRPDGSQFLPDTATEQIRADLARTYVLFLSDPEPGTVRFLREELVDGRAANVIELNNVGDMPLRLFVDIETGDVVKKMFVGDTPYGMAQVEEFLSDFREVGGYRIPHSKRVMRNGKLGIETTITNIEVNAGLQKEALLQ